MKGTERLFVLVIFILLPFEDSLLQATPLGYAGAGAAVIPIAALAILKYRTVLASKELLLYLGYALPLSLAMALYYADYSTFLVITQGAKALVLNALLVITFVYFKRTNIDMLGPSVALVLVVSISLFLSLFYPSFIDGASPVHFTETRNYRPRGFSLEASTYGYLCGAAILLLSWRAKVKPFIALAILIILSLLIESKGMLLASIATAVATYVVSGRNSKGVAVIGVASASIVGFVLLPALQSAFLSDIQSYTSVATRSTLAILALQSILIYPTGNGFTGFLPFLYEQGPMAIEASQSIFSGFLNYSEVSGYFIEGATSNVGMKSYALDNMVYLGIPFVYVYLRYLNRAAKMAVQSSDSVRLSLVIFTSLALTFYISGVGSYIAAVSLGLSLNEKI